MSDAIQFPPHPDLGQYKKLAKDLLNACRSNDTSAVRAFAMHWEERIARLKGRKITAGLRKEIQRDAEQFERHWKEYQAKRESDSQPKLADAQFFIARQHGFATWQKFVAQLEGLAKGESIVAAFEAAADAIVTGDIPTLKKLLRKNPALIRACSTREHHSTLLHYVSANGVEDFRQKTPGNIVAITKVLLKAGAEVDAKSQAYGGSTALGLVATSAHPEQAGLQIKLLETLLDHGARIDHPGLTGSHSGTAIRGALANGCGEAARFFASRGAHMNLEEAAGVGRLDIVKSFFDARGQLKDSTMKQQMEDGFLYACGYGHPQVVQFLLECGLDPNLSNSDAQTGLHWAMYGPHVEVVRLLLRRGATVHAWENARHGDPLAWALSGWAQCSAATRKERFREAVELLIEAGARFDPQWYGHEQARKEIAAKIESDPHMQAALRRAVD